MSDPPASVLVVGWGPPPAAHATHTGFAQLRTATFCHALARTGAAVDVVLLTSQDPRTLAEAHPRAAAALGVRRVAWLALPGSDRPAHDPHGLLHDPGDPTKVVVGAGPYVSGAVAVELAAGRPVWVDLPGDPLAELGAWCSAMGRAAPPERLAAAVAAVSTALAGADVVSVVSGPQRAAALGQLGLLGRLAVPVPPPVHVVPIAAPPLLQPGPREAGRPRVALMGALNTWLDLDTTLAALDLAMARLPGLGVVLTGGPLAEYPQASAQLRAWAGAHPGRVEDHGWVAGSDLAGLIGGCDVGLCLDRPGPEPTLGSRTRVLHFLAMGVPVVATAETELVAALAAEDMVWAVPCGDPAAVAQAILATVGTEAPASAARTARARAHIVDAYGPDRTTGPLVRWVAEPTRATPGAGAAAALAGTLGRTQAELDAVYRSPTWRALARLRGVAQRVRSKHSE